MNARVTLRKSRKIAPLLDWPHGAERRYESAAAAYRWFRKGENRFSATGLHGFSGSLFFEAFDKGYRDLPRDEFMAELEKDYNSHLKRRFKTSLRSVKTPVKRIAQ